MEEKEIWKDMPDFEELYQISNLGRVKTKAREIKRFLKYNYHIQPIKERILKLGRIREYPSVGLWKNGKMYNIQVHRLVAKAFIPNPNNYPIINHIDGNKENNKVDNLEWCTYSHNVKEAYRLGLMNISEKHIEKARHLGIKSGKKVVQKDSNNNVINIFRSGLQASKITGITQSQISLCCNNKIDNAGGYKWEYIDREVSYE